MTFQKIHLHIIYIIHHFLIKINKKHHIILLFNAIKRYFFKLYTYSYATGFFLLFKQFKKKNSLKKQMLYKYFYTYAHKHNAAYYL